MSVLVDQPLSLSDLLVTAPAMSEALVATRLLVLVLH